MRERVGLKVTAIYAISENMAGRPKNVDRPQLADKFRMWVTASGLNYSQIGRLLGVDVSTISRLLKSGRFSETLEARVQRLMNTPTETVGATLENVGSFSGGMSARDLRLLRKFVKLIPEAQKVLSTALDRPVLRRES